MENLSKKLPSQRGAGANSQGSEKVQQTGRPSHCKLNQLTITESTVTPGINNDGRFQAFCLKGFDVITDQN
jgi:hypothetical protein